VAAESDREAASRVLLSSESVILPS
jgi:hypothetical protein